jgi:hypothetical protein
VTNTVAARIYHDDIPVGSDPAFPVLVLQSWFIRDIATSAGAAGFETHRLQVDAYARSRVAADALMDSTANALDPRAPNARTHIVDGLKLTFRQDTGGGRPTYERDTKLYRRSMDFKVQAARAA